MSIQLEQLTKRYEGRAVVSNVSLDVASGQLCVLLGPSGSGKSTVLRLIAGLSAADSGQIRLDGRDLAGVPAQKRGCGFVFQSYALFRQMTVAENVEFALAVRRVGRAERRRRREELLELVGLAGLGGRLPTQLSGGQQQRVALARALVGGSRVLVLDDPMSAVDTETERHLIETLRPAVAGCTVLISGQRLSTVLVADRAVVLHEGRIVEDGVPDRLILLGGHFTALFGEEAVAA